MDPFINKNTGVALYIHYFNYKAFRFSKKEIDLITINGNIINLYIDNNNFKCYDQFFTLRK